MSSRLSETRLSLYLILRFSQIFSDKTVEMPKSTALVASPVFALLLRSSVLYRRGFLEKCLTLLGCSSSENRHFKEIELSREANEELHTLGSMR